MTKVIKIEKNGGPEVLEVVDVKVGKPGPEEIKIKNIAIGLNYIDTYHRSGLYPLKLPSGIGMEAAGIVQEIGSEVKNFIKNPTQSINIQNEVINILSDKLSFSKNLKNLFCAPSPDIVGRLSFV